MRKREKSHVVVSKAKYAEATLLFIQQIIINDEEYSPFRDREHRRRYLQFRGLPEDGDDSAEDGDHHGRGRDDPVPERPLARYGTHGPHQIRLLPLQGISGLFKHISSYFEDEDDSFPNRQGPNQGRHPPFQRRRPVTPGEKEANVFTRDSLLQLSEILLSDDHEDEFFPSDACTSDGLTLSSLYGLIESPKFLNSENPIEWEEKKVLFGKILTRTTSSFFFSTRFASFEILKHLFTFPERRATEIRKEGSMRFLLKELMNKKERDDRVRTGVVHGMFYLQYYMKMDRMDKRRGLEEAREIRERMWEMEEDGGSDSLIASLNTVNQIELRKQHPGQYVHSTEIRAVRIIGICSGKEE
jgi:hypothetical protein